MIRSCRGVRGLKMENKAVQRVFREGPQENSNEKRRRDEPGRSTGGPFDDTLDQHENDKGQPDHRDGDGRDMGKEFHEIGFEQPDGGVTVVYGQMGHGVASR